ncbi:hypothetical protein L3X38_025574 [Prunus dulcis]|uniref:Uncharacterized protein n=1 Tax=Prunus dulcis TaxID=3755 RepID=A0AAD4W2R0_PRUDU|nr:hypothetical protein L3X38_025574 [Prunus dulcis]
MHAYIWAQGDDVWDLVLEGYVAPTKTERTIEKRKIETKDGVEEKDVGVSEFQIPKPKIEWTTEEKAMSVYNQKGIHAIFDVVSSEQFAHIRNCQTSMEAWDNLMIVHEGNNKVRKSKLQRLTSQFEKLEMPYVEFYEKIIGIVNSCASLGKVKLEVDVVEKILRSLPVRLHPKKTAIEEARDIDTFSLADLTLSACLKDKWYFDSGCSRHIGDKNWFESFVDMKVSGSVTFGEGLSTNLLSISQLCDEFGEVKFNTKNCIVSDLSGKQVQCQSTTLVVKYILVLVDDFSRAYRVYNHRTKIVMESINVVIDDCKTYEPFGECVNITVPQILSNVKEASTTDHSDIDIQDHIATTI